VLGRQQWITLTAHAEDADGDPLSYRWTTPDEIEARDQHDGSIRVRVLDGLPDETFGVEVAISDGHDSVTATHRLKLSGDGFTSKQFLGAILSDPHWTFDPPEKGLDWVPLLNQDVVACNAIEVRRSATIAMGRDMFWRVRGKLAARFSEQHDRYGAIAVRLELGDVGWSLVCTQAGNMGAEWSIELVQEGRLAGVWEPRLSASAPRKVEWLEADDATQTPYAELVLTRRRGEIELQWGQGETFEREVVPVPDGVEPSITLWGDRGGGEFHGFTKW